MGSPGDDAHSDGTAETMAAPASDGSLDDTVAPATAAATTVGLRTVSDTLYRRGSEIGRGGMGRIIAAEDLRLERPVAVKELLSTNPGLVARFEHEARVTARLQHPSIVPIYEAGRWPNGEMFYAMKLVSGRSLAEAISELDQLSGRLGLLRHITAVADALAYAHSQRIVHRDLKPANVIVGEFGETVVIDWGLAKLLDDADDVADSDEPAPSASGSAVLTAAGQTLGTPVYMPPEQAQGQTIDQTADVYALGAMLYQLLLGKPPFADSDSAAEVLARILTERPEPISILVPEAPPELVAIVDRAMAHDPGDRYPSARELAEDLRRFETGKLVSAHHYSVATLVRRWLARHRAVVVAVVVMLMVLAAGAVWSVRRIMTERDAAVAAERETEEARAAEAANRRLAEQRSEELLLQNARVAADTDPTRALAWLRQRTEPIPGPGLLFAGLVDGGIAEHVLAGHDGPVNAVAYAPDGARVASAGVDRSVRLWDLATGSRRVVLDAKGRIAPFSFSPDGRWLMGGDDQGAVHLWSVADLSYRALPAHGDRVIAAAFTPDSSALVTADRSGEVRSWSLAGGSGRVIGTLGSGVNALAFSPDGSQLAAVTMDGGVYLGAWPGPLARIAGADSWLLGLCFTPDGEYLAWSGDGGAVAVRAVAGGEVRYLTGYIDAVRSVGCADDRVYAVGDDSIFRMWSITGERSDAMPMADEPLQIAGHWSPGADLGVMADTRGSVWVLDVARRARRPLIGHQSWVFGMALSADGRSLVTGGADGTVRIWRLGDEARATYLGHRGRLTSVDYSPDGRTLASASRDGTVRLWSATGPTVLDSGGAAYLDCSFAPDSDRVVCATSDRQVHLWTRSIGERQLLETGGASVRRVSFGPAGTRVAATTTGGEVLLWSLPAGQRVELAGHTGEVNAIVFEPGGGHLLSAGADGVVRRWTLASGNSEVLARHDGGASELRVSADGQRAVWGSRDGGVHLWDAVTGKTRELGRHLGGVHAIALDPTGARVASGAWDGVIRIWDLVGDGVETLPAQASFIGELAFTPDGRYLVALTPNDLLRIHDLESGDSRQLRAPFEWNALALSPDGRRVAVGRRDNAVDQFTTVLAVDDPAAWIAEQTSAELTGDTLASPGAPE